MGKLRKVSECAPGRWESGHRAEHRVWRQDIWSLMLHFLSWPSRCPAASLGDPEPMADRSAAGKAESPLVSCFRRGGACLSCGLRLEPSNPASASSEVLPRDGQQGQKPTSLILQCTDSSGRKGPSTHHSRQRCSGSGRRLLPPGQVPQSTPALTKLSSAGVLPSGLVRDSGVGTNPGPAAPLQGQMHWQSPMRVG